MGLSQTALRVAFARAWESQLPEDERICHDPLAEHLLPDEGVFLLKTREGRERFTQEMAGPVWEGLRGYVALRTRVIDALSRDVVARGGTQLLILGAGYDSRAHRIPELHGRVKVFEVDRPETQEDKKTRLAKHFGALPDYVTFVPMDFETGDLAAGLAEARFDSAAKTLVIWEGGIQYLEPKAVAQTLDLVSSHTPAGSSLIVDYVAPVVVDGTTANPVMQVITQVARGGGEPFKFGMDRQGMARFLERYGFAEEKNLTVRQCKEKYLIPAQRDRSFLEECSIMQAVVT